MQKELAVPPVMWCQRSAAVLLTINVQDVKNPEVKFAKDSVFFKGTGGAEKKDYELAISLFKEIDPEKCKSFNRERCIEVVLAKADTDEPYWPVLTSDKKKHHWLKCDFNKWHDEDESGDEGVDGVGGDYDLDEMMKGMELGGGEGAGRNFDLEGTDDGEDSDDEPVPDSV